MTKYYTLLVKDSGKWFPVFAKGGYERETVADEMRDVKDQWLNDLGKAPAMKIICTDESQSAINDAIERLNQ